MKNVVFIDFEYMAPPGERPDPVCLVALDATTGREIRWWRDELLRRDGPPYPLDADTAIVAYYASAEVGCHLALDWPMPSTIIDLFVEFKLMTNGKPVPCGHSLLGALTFFGLPAMEAEEKHAMRELAQRGAWTPDERCALLDYCASDVHALARLWQAMAHAIDLPRARLRGRYMAAAARIEYTGIPIDVETLGRLRGRWADIKLALVDAVDEQYHVYQEGSFNAQRFAAYLAREGIPWPRLPSGALALDDDSFRVQTRSWPQLHPLRELRHALSQLRLEDLTVGGDGRNRYLLSAFRAKTGRNAPSNTKSAFGPATWVRSLIKPTAGAAVAYVDWCQQEFGIAAALSGDPAMLAAYVSGDPYRAFAEQAGALAHGGDFMSVRERYKTAALAVQYGQQAEGLAARTGQTVADARRVLREHRQLYGRFWAWSDGALDAAHLLGELWTVYGWRIAVGPGVNVRMLRNWPMQANGAEMLRLACILATERGVAVCAPIHDALLIQAPTDEIEPAVAVTQQAMSDASAAVLGGFRLRSEAKIVKHPNRYQDPRGEHMWTTVMRLLDGHQHESDRLPVNDLTQTRNHCVAPVPLL